MTGGETGGTIEVLTTPIDQFSDLFKKNFADTPLAGYRKKFTENYADLFARVSDDTIDRDRAVMPVIDRSHIQLLHHCLCKGQFDIAGPYNEKLADLLQSSGHGNHTPTEDDIAHAKTLTKKWKKKVDHRQHVEAHYAERRARKLKPIQKQIYLDKVFDGIKKVMAAHPEDVADHLGRHILNSTLIVSGNNEIIDGHHRWGTMMLWQPKFRMNTMVIDLDLEMLLQVTMTFTALIGNKANT